MSKVAVITEALRACPRDRAEGLNIKVIPVIVHYRGKSYRDWIELSISQAYQFLDESPQ